MKSILSRCLFLFLLPLMLMLGGLSAWAGSDAPTTISLTGPLIYKGFTSLNEVHWYSLTLGRKHRCRLAVDTYKPLAISLYGPNSQTRLVASYTANSVGTSLYTPVIGPGQYFFKVQIPPGRTDYSVGYILLLREANVTGFRVNNGAAETTSRLVMLTSECATPPAYYKASVKADLYDTGWLPWKSPVPFKLEAGNLVKTVYFKVKHADGNESEAVSDTIVLKETVPLAPGPDWRTGNIQHSREIDWYRFTAPAAGTYLIETQCGSLEDTVMELLDAGGKRLMTANDAGEEYAAKISAPLPAGKYTVKVYSHFIDSQGTYSIRVQRIK